MDYHSNHEHKPVSQLEASYEIFTVDNIVDDDNKWQIFP
jgi:hypothetical protein